MFDRDSRMLRVRHELGGRPSFPAQAGNQSAAR